MYDTPSGIPEGPNRSAIFFVDRVRSYPRQRLDLALSAPGVFQVRCVGYVGAYLVRPTVKGPRDPVLGVADSSVGIGVGGGARGLELGRRRPCLPVG